MMIVFRCYECVGRGVLDGGQASKIARARGRERDPNNKLLEMYCIPFDACVFFGSFFFNIHITPQRNNSENSTEFICIYAFDIH